MGMMNQSTLMVLCNSTQKEVLAKSRSLANAVQTNHRLVPIPSGPEADLVIVTIRRGTAATDNWPLLESAFAGERTFELPQNFAIHFHPGAGTIEEFAGVRLMDSFPKLPLFIGGIFMNLCDESKSGKVWTLGPTFHGCHDAPLSLPRAAPPVPHHSVNPSAETISLGDSGVPRRLTSRVLKRRVSR